MLGARGVALGLGRVNLNDLKSGLSAAQMRQAATARAMAKKEKSKAPKVIVKKRVDRQTLWAACRAVLFGSVLITLGATMATIGYYSAELSLIASFPNNDTKIYDEPRKLQLSSLSYIGPVVMGVGAFILMIACVMTLESRDKHAEVVHEFQRDGKISRNPSSFRNSPKPPEEQQTLLNISTVAEEPDLQKLSLKLNSNYRAKQADGVPSKSIFREDSNGTSGKANDSFPPSTTTTTLTAFSKSMKDSELGTKFPSTSCIDVLMKKTDTRAMLKRFLADQSKITGENVKLRGAGSLKKQSCSLEIPGTEKVRVPNRSVKSEDIPARHSVVTAEVHSPPCPAPQNGGNECTPVSSPPCRENGLSPIARPESVEPLELEDPSPMSSSSENRKRTETAPNSSGDTHSVSSFVTVRSHSSAVNVDNFSPAHCFGNSPSVLESEFHSLNSSAATLQEESKNGNEYSIGSPLPPLNNSDSSTQTPWIQFNSN